MSAPDLEPMPPELEALLRSERAAPAPSPRASNRVFERLTHSIAALPVAGALGQAAQNGDAANGVDAAVENAASGNGLGGATATGGAVGIAKATGAAGVVKAAAGGALATGGVVKTAGLLLTSKLVFGTATFLAGGLVGAGVHSAVEPAPKPQIIRLEVPVPVPIEVQAPPAVVPAPVAMPEPVRSAPRPVVTEPIRPAPVISSPAVDRDSALASERAVLEIARTSLSRQKPEDALEALARYSRKFPKGQLSEEANALHVQALVGAGHFDDAKDAAKAFKDKYRSSLLAPAVDAAIREIR
ncbi:MAG: tetratricopeptide repeat protein [Myxococcaceae bacterium]